MISSLEFECERRLHVKMEKLTLVKKNDRCFTNPFLAAQQPASIESYKVYIIILTSAFYINTTVKTPVKTA